MKFSHLFLAASLFTFTAATAQTTPTPNGPGTAPGAPGTTTASPSAVPSGTAPVQANPDGAVSAGEVFTKGAPMTADERRMKRQQHKAMKADGKGKMKTKM
ncbi:hypothetical protein QMK33_04895 [Hymenobacter sp. H14-R3]|uniref:hypothetical protein n=1 Tax=Hymenobacter sp. H14-R3 TaxID=3046308 RepID=UPI0024B9B88D|nr:hypothetical protein [Hymenobacter sp. H14-R3]MDJ0364479.1 hypothetical protein [Hymenobacter sp. H14-R3]